MHSPPERAEYSASQFTVGQLGNLGDDFNGPGTIATTTTRVSYGLEIGDEVHIDPTGSPIHLAGCPGSPMASIITLHYPL